MATARLTSYTEMINSEWSHGEGSLLLLNRMPLTPAYHIGHRAIALAKGRDYVVWPWVDVDYYM